MKEEIGNEDLIQLYILDTKAYYVNCIFSTTQINSRIGNARILRSILEKLLETISMVDPRLEFRITLGY